MKRSKAMMAGYLIFSATFLIVGWTSEAGARKQKPLCEVVKTGQSKGLTRNFTLEDVLNTPLKFEDHVCRATAEAPLNTDCQFFLEKVGPKGEPRLKCKPLQQAS